MANSIKDKIINWFIKDDNTYRLLSWFINPIAYSTLPILAYIIYMAENNFFSYDFFTNGMFGLNTFFIIALLFSLFIGVFLTGFIIPLISLIKQLLNTESIKDKPDSLIFFILIFSINISVNIALYNQINNHTAQIAYGLIGFLINFHIGILLFCSPKIKLISLVIITGTLYLVMLKDPTSTSKIVEMGMNKFNIRTNSNIVIYNDNNYTNKIIQGKLILLTPNKIFIDNNGLKIMERSGKIIDFHYENNNSREHNKT